MANKKNEYKLLNMPLPKQSGYSKIKIGWNGLDENGKADNGRLSKAINVSYDNLPCLEPELKVYELDFAYIDWHTSTPPKYIINISVPKGERNRIFVVGELNNGTRQEYVCIRFGGNPVVYKALNIRVLTNNNYSKNVAKFSQLTNIDNIATTETDDYYVSGNYYFEELNGGQFVQLLSTEFPNTYTYCTQYLSRMFVCYFSKIYASKFNDFKNWDFDTAINYSPANAWMTVVTNSGDNNFHTIIEYSNALYVFSKKNIYVINGTKNPFRIQPLSSIGGIMGSVVVTDNRLIFVGFDGYVYMFNGATFINISEAIEKIDVSKSTKAYGYRNKYYLNTGTKTYIYDIDNRLWSTSNQFSGTLEFTESNDIKNGGAASECLCVYNNEGKRKIVTEFGEKQYPDSWGFETTLNLLTLGTKKIQKIQCLCEFEPNASVDIYILKDGEELPDTNRPLPVYSFTNGSEQKQHLISFVPPKTANKTFKLYFDCKKYIKFYELETNIVKGGEIVNG